ncbi:MAG: DegT/DnrJ/EryC1/StrS family aminotransferase [Patescibacteria group bacterium]
MNKENLGVGCFVPSLRAEKYILQVLRSGRLSYGPFIQRFEREFAKAHDVKYAVMVNSGTSALRIAFACLKEVERWKDGDEVIVPAITFVATVNTVISNGLKPVFVDVDPRTYNIDPAEIEKKVTRRTRAIVPVHLMGQSSEMEPIMKIANKHNLKVVEDSCETMFTNYKGRSVGSFGDISCFSTYVAHLIVTGVGGLALTSNPKYAEVLRSLANHGRDNIYISIDDAKGKKGELFKQIIARRFRFIRPGYSFRVTEFEGALGCAEMEIAPKMMKHRRKNGAYLLNKLAPFAKYLQLPWHPPYSGHAFMMFPLVVKRGSGVNKQELVNYLEKHGVETRSLMPLINQPYLKKMYKIRQKQYPVADWINKNGFYIGCHQKMGKKELDYIARTFTRFFSSKGRSGRRVV